MKKKIKFKKMKLLLLIVLLITNTICADDCTSLLTENTCKGKTGCKWTAATCSGHNSCTSKTTSQSECTGTSYKEQVSCTYTPAVTTPATCTGDDVCKTVNELDDNSACIAKKYGGTACTYTAAVGETLASCGGDGGTVCSSVDPLTEENCKSTFYNQETCSYTAESTTSPATCTGDTGTVCSGVTALTSPKACQDTTYEGTTSKNCVYTAGSCTADTPQETEESEETEETEETKDTEKPDTSGTNNNGGDTSNTEKDNSGYIKFSLLFSLLYLLF